MSVKKSRKYDIDGTNYAFEFVSDKLAGIKQEINGVLNPIPPKGSQFADISTSDEGLNAFNVAKFGSNKEGYVDAIEKLSDEELQTYYNEEKKKLDNQQFVDNVSEQPIAFTSPRDTGSGYTRGNTRSGTSSEIMAYPLDIDLNQDHFKITRYKYIRPDINQSKPQRQESVADGFGTRPINVAGDSVIGSKLGGSIILPMPKATDVNGVEWGGSDLTATGLFALGAAQKADESVLAGVMGGVIGASAQEALRASGVTFGTGTATGISGEQLKAQRDAKKNLGRGDATTGNATGVGQAITAQAISSAASLFGADIDTDVFLARTGGRVLNPNAEMLFQGPVIRDFSFEFTMIARSEREGREIRKIIRFLKTGMAPKFQNTAFLANPDVFTLEYKNGPGKNDRLKTVNLFNPGGLALTTLKTDYAPSGYWSAYRDSQPVALKLSLSFTELRPIYEGDQEDNSPSDSVGY